MPEVLWYNGEKGICRFREKDSSILEYIQYDERVLCTPHFSPLIEGNLVHVYIFNSVFCIRHSLDNLYFEMEKK